MCAPTIKLRREDRRARLLDAKEVAADGLRYAGRVGVSAGSSGAVMAWNGLVSALGSRLAVQSRECMRWPARQNE